MLRGRLTLFVHPLVLLTYFVSFPAGGKVPPEHLRLVLLGGALTGKSSTGNTILGGNVLDVNRTIEKRTKRCVISHGVVENRRLIVVDAPGWFYIHSLHDTSEMDKLEMESSHLCPPGPHAVLLVIDLTTAIGPASLRGIQEHMSLFGEVIWKHTIVLFTLGDWLGGKTVEEHIECDEGLRWVVNKCGNRYHAHCRALPNFCNFTLRLKWTILVF
uniref:AIG1-type G domain-containing protein n=1 Tax=Kryptolebias marmoratus TaxID=37003 RepID=A0A3Q3BHI9_KRYMA